MSNAEQVKQMIYCTDDIKFAMKWGYTMRIMCKDNLIMYSSWSLFSGCPYFDNYLESKIEPSHDQLNDNDNKTQLFGTGISFDFITSAQLRTYINMVVKFSHGGTFDSPLNLSWLYDLYIQAKFHRLTPIMDYVGSSIKHLPYDQKNANFLIENKILPISDILDKYLIVHKVWDDRLLTSVNVGKDKWLWVGGYSPIDNPLFIFALRSYALKSNIVVAWCIYLRYLDIKDLELALDMFQGSISHEDLKLLHDSPQDGIDNIVSIFVKCSNYRNEYFGQKTKELALVRNYVAKKLSERYKPF